MGPSTFARSILISAIERNGSSPRRDVKLDDLAYLLERNLTSAVRERSDSASKYTTSSDTEKSAILLLDKSQVDNLGELGLKAITLILARHGVLRGYNPEVQGFLRACREICKTT